MNLLHPFLFRFVHRINQTFEFSSSYLLAQLFQNASTSTPVPSTSSPPSQTNQTHENSTENFDLISIFDGNHTDSNDTLRFPRQQDVDVNKNSSSTSAEKESQEEEDEEDENMITGLLNAFLSGLSRVIICK